MSLSQDLMGLGVSPLQAAHTASGGTGPLTMVTGATSSAGASVNIGAFQYIVSVNGGVSTGGVKLPTVGGDTGCLLADDFVVNNAGTTTIYLFASSGVSISTGGANTSYYVMPLHTSITLYPITTTQWIGVKGV